MLDVKSTWPAPNPTDRVLIGWYETAPCGCLSAYVSATYAPTKAEALTEFAEGTSDGVSRGWPIALIKSADRPSAGCHHRPQWTAP